MSAPTTTKRITIPTSSAYTPRIEARRTLLAALVNGFRVVYDYDHSAKPYPSVTLSVEQTDNVMSYTSDMTAMLRGDHTHGRTVLVSDIMCGGGASDVTISGSMEEAQACYEAVPGFYASEREPEARATLRTIYRQLTKHVSA